MTFDSRFLCTQQIVRPVHRNIVARSLPHLHSPTLPPRARSGRVGNELLSRDAEFDFKRVGRGGCPGGTLAVLDGGGEGACPRACELRLRGVRRGGRITGRFHHKGGRSRDSLCRTLPAEAARDR